MLAEELEWFRKKVIVRNYDDYYLSGKISLCLAPFNKCLALEGILEIFNNPRYDWPCFFIVDCRNSTIVERGSALRKEIREIEGISSEELFKVKKSQSKKHCLEPRQGSGEVYELLGELGEDSSFLYSHYVALRENA